jgi:hypothetical protein
MCAVGCAVNLWLQQNNQAAELLVQDSSMSQHLHHGHFNTHGNGKLIVQTRTNNAEFAKVLSPPQPSLQGSTQHAPTQQAMHTQYHPCRFSSAACATSRVYFKARLPAPHAGQPCSQGLPNEPRCNPYHNIALSSWHGSIWCKACTHWEN